MSELKLFEVPAQKRKVTFYLETFKVNRIATKLIDLLKEFSNFEVKAVEGFEEKRIFEISIFSYMDQNKLAEELKKEIIVILGVHFPDNYLFNFKDKQLGYVNSFNVFSENGFHFEACHKIKEIRSKGNTLIPEQKIIV